MLPIAASTTLADVSVLLGVGAADSKAASLANSQGPSTQGLPCLLYTSQLVIQVVSGNSIEIIRKIPAEEVVQFAHTLDSPTGNLVQSKA